MLVPNIADASASENLPVADAHAISPFDDNSIAIVAAEEMANNCQPTEGLLSLRRSIYMPDKRNPTQGKNR
jgi:hypothetical protein